MALRLLEYAPEPVRWYSRQNVRRAAVGILIATAIVLVVFGARTGWERYQEQRAWTDLLARQQQSMSYAAASNFVVCEDDPRKFEKLLASDPNYIRWDGEGPDAAFVGYVPSTIRQLREFGANNDLPVAFLHERRSPAGISYLVLVNVRGIGRRGDVLLVAYSAVPAKMGTRRFAPSVLHDRGGGLLNIFCDRGPDQHFTFTAGQPDFSDPTHFTLGYKFANQPGTIDGWLMNGGEVMMQVRDGPAKMKSTNATTYPAS